MMKIADSIAKLVHRDYWRNIHKMIKYNDIKALNDEKKRCQQEKLESLVSKQLQLSTKMADFLNSNSKKQAEEEVAEIANEITEGKKEEEEEEDEEKVEEQLMNQAHKALVIELNKEPNNKYSVREILYKDIDIAGIFFFKNTFFIYFILFLIKMHIFFFKKTEQKHSLEEIVNYAEKFKPNSCTLMSSEMSISQPFLLKNELRYTLTLLNNSKIHMLFIISLIFYIF